MGCTVEVTFENHPADIQAVLSGLSWKDRIRDFVQNLSLVTITWPLFLLFAILNEQVLLGSLAAGVAICIVIMSLLYFRAWTQAVKNAKVIPGQQTLRLHPDYLELSADRGASRRRWNDVPRVQELPDFVTIYIHPVRAYVVPKRYFDSPEQASAFAARAEELRTAAIDTSPPPLSWEQFHADFQFDRLHLIQAAQWQHDPSLLARLRSQGVNADGNNDVPSTWELIKQTVFPLCLVLMLIVLKWYAGITGGFFYYPVLILASLFLLVFGLLLFNRLRFLSERNRDQSADQLVKIWIYEEGLACQTLDDVSLNRWKVFDSIVEDQDAFALFDAQPFIHFAIPKAAIPTTEKQTWLLERIKSFIDTAHGREEEIVLAEVSDNPFQSPMTQ